MYSTMRCLTFSSPKCSLSSKTLAAATSMPVSSLSAPTAGALPMAPLLVLSLPMLALLLVLLLVLVAALARVLVPLASAAPPEGFAPLPSSPLPLPLPLPPLVRWGLPGGVPRAGRQWVPKVPGWRCCTRAAGAASSAGRLRKERGRVQGTGEGGEVRVGGKGGSKAKAQSHSKR